MSINRSPFNALVDDDGSNTKGTPWNKQAIKDVILDPTDAEFAAAVAASLARDETITGLKTFSRGTNPPFAVNAGAAKVANLDADKLDGLDSTQFIRADSTWNLLPPALTAVGGGTVTVTANNGCQYTVMGKTMIVSFYLNITIAGLVSGLFLPFAAGILGASVSYQAAVFYRGTGASFAQVTPGGGGMNLYADPGLTNYPTGGMIIAGSIAIAIA